MTLFNVLIGTTITFFAFLALLRYIYFLFNSNLVDAKIINKRRMQVEEPDFRSRRRSMYVFILRYLDQQRNSHLLRVFVNPRTFKNYSKETWPILFQKNKSYYAKSHHYKKHISSIAGYTLLVLSGILILSVNMNNIIEIPSEFSIIIDSLHDVIFSVTNVNYFHLIPFVCLFLFYFIARSPRKKYSKRLEKSQSILDFSPYEVAFVLQTHYENKEIIAELIYLANLNYIKIEDFDDLYISKQKDYSNSNSFIYFIMDHLFVNSNRISYKDIQKSFKGIIGSLNRGNEKNDLKQKYFVKSFGRKFFVLFLFFIVSINLLIAKNSTYFLSDSIAEDDKLLVVLSSSFEMIGSLIFIFMSPFIISFGLYIIRNSKSLKKIGTYIVGMIILLTFGITFFVSLLPSIPIENNFLFLFISHCALTVMGYYILFVKRRSDLGENLNSIIFSFKKNLKSKISSHVFNNPEYLLKILPYAYSLHLEKIWLKKYVTLQKNVYPKWYVSNNHFHAKRFINILCEKTFKGLMHQKF